MNNLAETDEGSISVFDDLDDDTILNELEDIENVDQTRGEIIYVHGLQGTGKTHFGYSMCWLDMKNPKASPELRTLLEKGIFLPGNPVIFYDTENKAYKLARRFPKPPKWEGDWVKWMSGYVADHNSKLPNGTESLKKLIKVIHALKKKYKRGTLVIDNISSINLWIRHYIKQEILKIEIAEKMDLTDWEHRTNIWEYILHELRDLQMNVVLISRHKQKWGVVDDDKAKKGYRLSKLEEYKVDNWDGIPFGVDFELALDKPGLEDDQGKTIRTAEILKDSLEGDEVANDTFENVNGPKFFEYLCKYFPIKENDPILLKHKKSDQAKVSKNSKKKVKKAIPP